MVISLLLTAVVLGLLPFLTGLLYTHFVEKEKNSILLNFAAGFLIMLGLFELVAIPLLERKQSLSVLFSVYFGLLLAGCLCSVLLNRKRFAEIIKAAVLRVKGFPLSIWAQLVLIAGQVLFYIKYSYSNADDSFFVAAATTAVKTNTIFSIDPYTGAAYESLPARYVLSPFYAFNAVISKAVNAHPAIVAHMLFMMIFLLLAYAVYALIGQALFGGDQKKTGCFLIFITVLNIFSAYSERTAGLFLLIRLWQGKALLAGVLLPVILYLSIRIFLWEGSRADWILLAFAMCACCMVSSMGIMLGAIMAGSMGILFAVRKKRLRLLCYTICCCIPNLLCAGIYLIIR